MSRRYTERRFDKNPYLALRTLYYNKEYTKFLQDAEKYLEYEKFDRYIEEVHFMRAKVYKKLRMFDECIEDLRFIFNKSQNTYALIEMFFTYYHLNMYKEVLELLPILYSKKCLNNYSVALAELIIKKQLGMSYKVKPGDKCDYVKYQIANYDEKAALNHIYNHKNPQSSEESKFNDNINIDYLYEVIRSSIDNNNKSLVNNILEIHIYSLSNVGVYKGNVCNYVYCVVVPNTNDIITMYPTDSTIDMNVELLNCDYSKLFNETNKVKTLSRIDKFNKKYGRV